MTRNVCPSFSILLLLVAICAALDETSLRSPDVIAGLRLYKTIAASNVGKNLLFSPVIISTAVRMVYLGASDLTKDQIQEAMRLSQDDQMDRLYLAFFMYGDFTKVDDYTPLAPRHSLPTANRLYGPTGYTFKETYLQAIRFDYGYKFKGLDFKGNASKAREAINGWVRNKTLSKIPKLFPEGSITTDDKLVLASAFALRASWMYNFDAKDTKPQSFRLANGSDVKVPMMECGPMLEQFYFNNTKFSCQVLKLAFKENREDIYFILPHRNQTLAALENLLETPKERELLVGTKPTYLMVTIPKFVLAHTTDLRKALKSVGIVDAFDIDKANFSGISDSGKLALTNAMHKSYVAFDERGTGLNARPGFPCEKQKSSEDLVSYILNGPFLFVVRDVVTRSVLLRGRVTNPVKVK